MFDFFEKKIKYPERQHASLEDNLRSEAAEHNFGPSTGKVQMLASWDDKFKSIPLDILHFTALNKRACILVMYSEDLIPNFETLKEVVKTGCPWDLHFSPYLRGKYPILRANLAFPDTVQGALWLEAPLDLSNGDIQDFCIAAIANEKIDLIIKHQSQSDGYHALSFEAKGISKLLKKEVINVIDQYKSGLTRQDFDASYDLLMQDYSSASDGLNPANILSFDYIGRARNAFLEYDPAGSLDSEQDEANRLAMDSQQKTQEIIANYALRLSEIPNVLDKGEGTAQCRAIGTEINEVMGLEGMRSVVMYVREHHDRVKGRCIESAWDRIGMWRG
jgi:hypothetical protein